MFNSYLTHDKNNHIKNNISDIIKDNDYKQILYYFDHHQTPINLGKPLYWAVICNKTDIALYLLDKGADIFHLDEYKNTLLDHAILKNNYIIVKKLLDGCLDPNHTSKYKQYSLLHACYKNNDDIIELLLTHAHNRIHKKNFNLKDADGFSPKKYLKKHKNKKMLKFLKKCS